MRPNNFDRRQFLKGLGCFSLGSSFFTLALPRGGWAASAAETSYRRSLLAMGTKVNITLFGETGAKAREAVRDAFSEIRRIDDLMSTHRRYSALSRVNRASGNGMIGVDSRIIEVLRASIEWSRKSKGIFDVTTLPLLRAWGFRDEDGEVPVSIAAALECVGYENIVIEGDRVGLLRAGAEIDLGGIAKGYAVDRAIGILRDRWGVEKAIVAAGGDLYALGRPEDAAGWEIGLKNPLHTDAICATFELSDAAVATSGAYETKKTRDGETYGDLMNPLDGSPAGHYLSTTAYASTATDADAASTVLFVSHKDMDATGPSAGIESLELLQSGNDGLGYCSTLGFPEFRTYRV